jgi:hypothetical protein
MTSSSLTASQQLNWKKWQGNKKAWRWDLKNLQVWFSCDCIRRGDSTTRDPSVYFLATEMPWWATSLKPGTVTTPDVAERLELRPAPPTWAGFPGPKSQSCVLQVALQRTYPPELYSGILNCSSTDSGISGSMVGYTNKIVIVLQLKRQAKRVTGFGHNIYFVHNTMLLMMMQGMRTHVQFERVHHVSWWAMGYVQNLLESSTKWTPTDPCVPVWPGPLQHDNMVTR